MDKGERGAIIQDVRRGVLRTPAKTNTMFSPSIPVCLAMKGASSAPLRDCGWKRLTGLAGAASFQAFRPRDLVRLTRFHNLQAANSYSVFMGFNLYRRQSVMRSQSPKYSWAFRHEPASTNPTRRTIAACGKEVPGNSASNSSSTSRSPRSIREVPRAEPRIFRATSPLSKRASAPSGTAARGVDHRSRTRLVYECRNSGVYEACRT